MKKKRRKYDYVYEIDPGTIEMTYEARPPSSEALRVHRAVMRRYLEQLKREREA